MRSAIILAAVIIRGINNKKCGDDEGTFVMGAFFVAVIWDLLESFLS
jgi:hypothetical protein